MRMQRTLSRRELLPLLPAALVAAGGGAVAQRAPPAGAVVLTLAGAVRRPNRGGDADFDMPMLEQMAQQRFSTTSPWYPRAVEFTGPLLADVLQAAGASGQRLRLSALNDYQVEMPADDAVRFGVVVARLLDGRPIAVRDKGPLFVIYPFSRHPQLRTAVYYSRCIWQLRRIDVA